MVYLDYLVYFFELAMNVGVFRLTSLLNVVELLIGMFAYVQKCVLFANCAVSAEHVTPR